MAGQGDPRAAKAARRVEGKARPTGILRGIAGYRWAIVALAKRPLAKYIIVVLLLFCVVSRDMRVNKIGGVLCT